MAGVVLVGPPAVEALSLDKPQESIDKVWRLVGSTLITFCFVGIGTAIIVLVGLFRGGAFGRTGRFPAPVRLRL